MNKLIEYSPQAIANIQTVEEAKDGYEKLRALVSYFSNDYDNAFSIAVSMIEYACRGGEIIESMKEGGELNGQGGDRKSKSQPATLILRLSDISLTRSQSSRWQKMASVEEEKRQEYYAKMLDKEELPTNAGVLRLAKQVKRDKERKAQIEEIERIPSDSGRYHVIVVDPPWNYNKRPNDVTHRAANPYPPMTIEQLEALEILYQDNCILWLWTTNAFMAEAHHLATCWGFQVKTILTWVKDRMGLGDWLRGQTEHCLMCVKGKPIVNLTNQTTVIYGPMREHSRKPDSFYEMVEALCPGSKIEYFARQQREGWATYGNETNKFQE